MRVEQAKRLFFIALLKGGSGLICLNLIDHPKWKERGHFSHCRRYVYKERFHCKQARRNKMQEIKSQNTKRDRAVFFLFLFGLIKGHVYIIFQGFSQGKRGNGLLTGKVRL